MLIDRDGGEAEAFEQAGDCCVGILIGGFEDAVLDGCGGEFFFGFFADLGFEIRIGRTEEAGVAGVDASFGIVDASAEDFRRRQVNGDVATVDGNVGWLKFGEIDPADSFSVDNEQQTIAGEEVRQEWIVVLAGNDFVHGVADGFEALELLNLADDGGLIDVEGDAAAGETEQVEQVYAGDEPDAESDDCQRGENAENCAGEAGHFSRRSRGRDARRDWRGG